MVEQFPSSMRCDYSIIIFLVRTEATEMKGTQDLVGTSRPHVKHMIFTFQIMICPTFFLNLAFK